MFSIFGKSQEANNLEKAKKLQEATDKLNQAIKNKQEATDKLKQIIKDKQEATDQLRRPTQEEIRLEQDRAWSLIQGLIVTLILSSLIYLYFHKQIDKKLTNVSSSSFDNILVTIRSTKKLIKDSIAQDKLKRIGEELITIETEGSETNQQLLLLKSIGNGLIDEVDIRQEQIQKYADLLELAKKEFQNSNSSSANNDNQESTNNPLVSELEKLSKENRASDIDPQQLQTYIELLELAEKEYLKAKNDNSFFWSSKPLIWIEIAFWGWVGTILYLLSEIYTHYPGNEDQNSSSKFIEFTSWYLVTLFRGTFIVFIILLGATTVEIGLGTSLSLGKVPIEAIIFAAGTLGYFNRVAKEQLILIVQKLFPVAWKQANPDLPTSPPELKIEPDQIQLSFDTQHLFKINSSEQVIWSTNLPKMGTFNLTEGTETTYTAPSESDAKNIKQIKIIATSVKEPNQTATAIIDLVPPQPPDSGISGSSFDVTTSGSDLNNGSSPAPEATDQEHR